MCAALIVETQQKSFMFKATKKIDTGAPHLQIFSSTLKGGGGNAYYSIIYSDIMNNSEWTSKHLQIQLKLLGVPN